MKEFNFIEKMAKFPMGEWFYNFYHKQHILLGDGGAYFYDLNYQLIYKEPKLRHMDTVHFVDEDLCAFVETSSTKILFYSIKTREIVNRYSLRFSKKQNEYLIEVENAFFCRKANAIIFYAWYEDKELKFGKYGIFAYNLNSKSYTKIVDDINIFARCFNYKNYYAFFNTFKTEVFMYVINENLECKKIEFDEHIYELKRSKYIRFDAENGLIVFIYKQDHFDGYTYYGNGTEFTAIDFDGNIQPWQPAHRYNEKPQKAISCNSDINFEDYVYEHGIDEFVAKNLSEEELESISEELLQGGYNWALEKIEKKAKDAGLGLYEFLGNEQIAEDESILYSVGWLQAEIENGGMEQYFSNGDKKEFDLLIKALTTVGATETVEAIKKGARIIATFNKKQNPTEYECEKLSEKFENLECELTEDYAKLTIQYIKKSKLQS